MKNTSNKNIYIALISIHGLLRSQNLELGYDADTGGQIKYVVDLATSLSKAPNVERVDLVTRLIKDDNIEDDYSKSREYLTEKARIIRIKAGPEKYLPKEKIWNYLDLFSRNLLAWFESQDRMPDIIHSHYADSGYVASNISELTKIPFAHTGHSLGRNKQKHLISSGMHPKEIANLYNIDRRIKAEEDILSKAKITIASTQDEVLNQYKPYNFYKPDSIAIIAPGINVEEFKPSIPQSNLSETKKTILPFLTDPDKPIILTISRPDRRKNITTLIRAYAESEFLQNFANLVIVAGNRDDIRKLNNNAQSIWIEILLLIDYYNLYGKVAFPKQHNPKEISAFYRLAALSQGIFINPALTEPFGLTLLESSACGLPFVATNNGGPVDIVRECRSGLLVDPLKISEIQSASIKLLRNRELWLKYSLNGIKYVKEKYSWEAHVKKYLNLIYPILESKRNPIARYQDYDNGNHSRIGPADETGLTNTTRQ